MDRRPVMEGRDLFKNIVELHFEFIFGDKSNIGSGNDIRVAGQRIIGPCDRLLIEHINPSLARMPVVERGHLRTPTTQPSYQRLWRIAKLAWRCALNRKALKPGHEAFYQPRFANHLVEDWPFARVDYASLPRSVPRYVLPPQRPGYRRASWNRPEYHS